MAFAANAATSMLPRPPDAISDNRRLGSAALPAGPFLPRESAAS